jgi:photosystem II stability/assembly factor-like uncharacterized protein
LKPFSKKNKIILIILVLVIYQNISLAQGTWERLNSPTTENLSSVYFVDSSYGWAAGHSGTIIHTSNGGDDWIIQDSKTENNIFDIFFLNRSLGWAVSWEAFNYPFGTYVLKTTDGGLNWNSSTFPEENIFSQCILFQDSLNGWMGGKPYPIVRTTDGGNSWTEAEIDSSDFSNFPVYDIQFYNSKFGYASGGVVDCCGIIWWTNNGGDNWSVIDTPFVAPEPIYQLYTKDSLNVLGVGGDFESWGFGVGMIRTSNGGVSWEFEYIGITGVAWDIDFRADYEAWAPLGGEQRLIYSLDAGSTWTPISTPDSAMILKMVFPDSLHGFGVGMEGAIIKYKPDINIINEETDFIPERIVLHQNYPNPFNPTTKIKFDVPAIGTRDRVTVQLRVYDILGSEVATLVNEELEAGNYEIIFDAEQLSGGVYFYILFANEDISAKKMILLR